MNGLLPCVATIDLNRHDREQETAEARDAMIDAISEEIGNTIEVALGSVRWTRTFEAACREIAEAKFKEMM